MVCLWLPFEDKGDIPPVAPLLAGQEWGPFKMKNLIFKNITSENRRQRILYSSESIEQEGIRTVVNRHLICRIRNVAQAEEFGQAPALYVIKKRNSKDNTEAFYCRIKGLMYMSAKHKLYLVSFIHSLRIQLKAISIPIDK